MKLKSLLNEAAWPVGHFEVTNRFQIGGGAWRMTFPKGMLVKVEQKGPRQYMFRWDAMKQDYVAKNPPFSGNEDGQFGLGGFQDMDARAWVSSLEKNSKKLSKGQADTVAKNMAQEKTLKARAAIKMLQKLPGSQMIKITIVN
jgi:hypothetical protein